MVPRLTTTKELKVQSFLKFYNLVTPTSPLLRTHFHGPKVMGFRCNCLAQESSDQIKQSQAKINEQKIAVARISQLIEVTKAKHEIVPRFDDDITFFRLTFP